MANRTKVFNAYLEPLTFPFPYVGILAPGEYGVIDDTPANVLANLGATVCGEIRAELDTIDAASISKSTASSASPTFTGSASFTGSVTLGDSAADNVTVTGSIVGNVVLKKEEAHTVAPGASTTTNADGAALTLDAGAKNGTGTDGVLSIGATNAESIIIGRTGKTVTMSGALRMTSVTSAFEPPPMTATQRDAITPVRAGMVIFNTTTNKLNVRGASGWEAVTST